MIKLLQLLKIDIKFLCKRLQSGLRRESSAQFYVGKKWGSYLQSAGKISERHVPLITLLADELSQRYFCHQCKLTDAYSSCRASLSTAETRPLEDRWRKCCACLSLNLQNANGRHRTARNSNDELVQASVPFLRRDSRPPSACTIPVFTSSADGCRWHPHGTCIRGESQAAVSVREVRNAFWCSHAHIRLIPDSLGVVCHFARGWDHLGFPCNSDVMTLGRGIKIKEPRNGSPSCGP